MNLIVTTYPILVFILLGLKRKPWFYGFTNQNPKLKSSKMRMTLIGLFSIHTLVALWYSTQFYWQALT
ncbi:hypothetical protein [Candidatus Berkiella aquae]|uniref:Uncharacterized protein n=1 Tax=Candidatus Berkiella aquae TaxID=295108 RepID=A0A0Q9YN38_9GAMM|nr:hypothetical protein [Candidatus Berkiella aquae]MCS5711652.1 hypothetical protein [Candidatus Berkiella aquae]